MGTDAPNISDETIIKELYSFQQLESLERRFNVINTV